MVGIKEEIVVEIVVAEVAEMVAEELAVVVAAEMVIGFALIQGK